MIRFRRDHEGGIDTFIRTDSREFALFISSWAHAKEAQMREHRERMAICKPGQEASPEPDHADTLILDFQPLEL